ncbi:MAG: type IV secretion system DNA-binding domain-containing protein [Patescibacteria group bacterium]|nr:type IV secretion system DNA-binding domain-containing protein [Patescibacteria group bacterium]MCX7589953.1 type IV secretion system DNA-binding domain-containing protein [Patescibacteria group bacterium]
MLKDNKIQRVKYASPPPGLPIYGQVNHKKATFIGITNYISSLEEKKFLFAIKRSDRKNHINIVGKSGVGKSKMLEVMIRQDVFNDYGLCLFDFNGDVVNNLLDFIPENKVDDVILIDFSNKNCNILFNPLYDINPNFKHHFVNGLIEVFKNQFGENWSWTPRMEHLFRFALLLLLEYPEATLKDMIFILNDKNFREKIINYSNDKIDILIKNFWLNDFENLSKFKNFNDEVMIPLINKISNLMSNPFLNNIFSNKKNKIDFNDFVNNKKIVLINLASQFLGKNEATFLGLILLLKLKEAGFLRVGLKNISEFYLYIDDFYIMNNKIFEDFLINSKKYNFYLTLSYNQISQFDQSVRNNILNMVGTNIIFRITNEDAQIFKNEMSPVFDVKDMINLGNEEFYIKMIVDGETKDPFSANSLKILKPPYPSNKNKIISNCLKILCE